MKGRAWSPEEDARLVKMSNHGFGDLTIGVRLGRSRSAVMTRRIVLRMSEQQREDRRETCRLANRERRAVARKPLPRRPVVNPPDHQVWFRGCPAFRDRSNADLGVER